MKSLHAICVLAIITALFTETGPFAATYYIAPNGNNSATGSLTQPFATLQKAHDVASAGDTVYIRGGRYQNNSARITKSGASASKRTCYWAYPGEKPVFDFVSNGAGILVTGS